eukprot:COSAG02_NODE_414_length_22826_cov_9.001364_9_plen_81_part_00
MVRAHATTDTLAANAKRLPKSLVAPPLTVVATTIAFAKADIATTTATTTALPDLVTHLVVPPLVGPAVPIAIYRVSGECF